MERENAKQKVRKAKEDLLELQLPKQKKTDEEFLKKVASVEHKILNTIELYKKYGSYDW